MKNTVITLIILVIFLSGCKKANEPDAVIYTDGISGVRIRYVVSVVDGSSTISKSDSAINNATVCVVVNDSIYETPVDKNGLAVFNNLFAGNTIVQIKCEGYTTANLIIDLKAMPDSDSSSIYDSSNRRVVSSIVSIFPTSGQNLASISGKIRAELDLTNTKLETVTNDISVRANVIATGLYNYVDHDCSGGVLDLNYSGFIITGNNSLGNYSLKVPASAKGLSYIINADDFEYLQQVTPSDVERKIYNLKADTIIVQAGGSYINDLIYE
ncbi:MAG: hypothetical protein PHE33_07705 [Bacteroidales bacterium]|nr:hypothetical protein [Bacteroidales bacterium]